MANQLVYIDAKGDKQALGLDLALAKEASDAGVSLKAYLNSKFPTDAAKHGTAFEQALEQCGIFAFGNREAGVRKSNFHDILNPSKEAASPIVRDGVPASRILFPIAILDVMEDKLQVNRGATGEAFAQMVGHTDNIQGTRFERAILNFDRPAEARSKPVSQLAMPEIMLSVTASDTSRAIPTWALGLEISEQALQITTIDLVGLALGRQAEIERNERVEAWILSLLNGDSDQSMVSLVSAGRRTEATDLDGTISATQLSQKAWMKWLMADHTQMTVSHIVTDIDTAMKIEGRSGKPVITTDNPNSPRIDTLFTVINPRWTQNVKIFLTEDSDWPADTIMGLDSRYAIHQVNSLSAQYSALEEFALKRSKAMRFDNGGLAYRLFNDAFKVLTLT